MKKAKNSNKKVLRVDQEEIKIKKEATNENLDEKSGFFIDYAKTILQIIEDKPDFNIPKSIYCLLIVIYHLQLLAFLITPSQHEKQITEQKFLFFTEINQISTGTFLLHMKGNDNLTQIVFYIQILFLLAYIIYIGVYSQIHKNFLKKPKNDQDSSQLKYYVLINKILNIVFTFYWYILLGPLLEINIGVLICGEMSFLVEYREPHQNGFTCLQEKRIDLIIFSCLGIFLIILSAFLIIFFYRNNEFRDQTSLFRRRFKNILILQLILRAILSVIYLINSHEFELMQHILSHMLGLIQIFDLIKNWPFTDIFIGKFFYAFSSIYYMKVCMYTIYRYTDQIHDGTLFYFFIIISVVIVGFSQVVYNYKYEKIMKLDMSKLQDNYQNLDFYLEELFRLQQLQHKNEYSKYKLMETFEFHQKNCRYKYCTCWQFKMEENQTIVEQQVVINFVDSLFRQALKSKIFQQNKAEIEHISLKYINFQKGLDINPCKAYYELKIMLQNDTLNLSYFFKLISITFSNNIQEQILEFHEKNEKTQVKKDVKYSIKLSKYDLDANQLNLLQQYYQFIIPQITEYIKQKHNFYSLMQKGYPNLDIFSQKAMILAKLGEKTRDILDVYLYKLEKVNQNNIIYHRIKSIYYCLILKEFSNSWKQEKLIADVKKRDMSKEANDFTNNNLANGNIVNVRVSLAGKKGRIKSTITPKMARFFGFKKEESSTIIHINQLLPQFLAKDHNEIMNNILLRKNNSPIINNVIQNFVTSKQKFIIPVQVYINYVFSEVKFDDFCLNATLLKNQDNSNFIIFNQYGFIEGITKDLFKKLFTQNVQSTKQVSLNNTSQKQEQQSKPDLTVQELYSNYLIQFMFPQLSHIFLTKLNNEYDYHQSQKHTKLLTQFKSRIKFPCFINQLQQDCLLNLKQGNDLSSKQSKFSMNSMYSRFTAGSGGQSQFGKTTKRIEKGETFRIKKDEYQKHFNFFKNKSNSQTFDFISDNKISFATDNCICDYYCDIDLEFSNIHFGHNFSKQLNYFVLKICNLKEGNDSLQLDKASTNNWISELNHRGLTQSYNTKTMTQKSGNNSQMYQKKSDRPIMEKIEENGESNMQVELNINDDDSVEETNAADQSNLNLITGGNDNKKEKSDLSLINVKIQDLTGDGQELINNAIQEKKNNYMENYHNTKNQAMKNGEMSRLPSPDISMIQEDLGNSKNFQAPLPDDQIPLTSDNRNDSFQHKVIENNLTEEKQQNSKSERKASFMLNKNEQHLVSKHNLEAASPKSIINSNMSQDLNDKKEEHIPTQMSDSIQQNIQKQTQLSKLLLKNKTFITGQSMLSQQQRKQKQNSLILQELFSPQSQPRSMKNFKYLILLFLFIYIVLNLVFILFFIGTFRTLLNKLELQNYPNMLNQKFQSALMSGIGLMQLDSEFLHDHELHDALKEELKTDFQESYESYLSEREEHFDDILNIEKSNFNNVENQIVLYYDEAVTEQEMTLSQIIEVITLELQRDILKYQQEEQLQQNLNIKHSGVYTLLKNQFKHDILLKAVSKIYADDASHQGDVIFNNFIYFTLCVAVIYIILFIVIIPVGKNLVSYQEKLLLLVLRIYEYESDIEKEKLKQSLIYLESQDEEWINTSFVDIQSSDQFNYFKNDSQKQQNLQGKIGGTQQLSAIKTYLIIFFGCLFVIIYFSSVILLIAFLIKELNPSKVLNAYTYEVNGELASFITQIEILITEEALLVIDPDMPKINRSMYLNNLEENSQLLTEFTQKFQYMLADSTMLSDEVRNEIEDIYQDDFTKIIDDEQIQSEPIEGTNYSNGIQGVITYLQQLKKESSEFLQVEMQDSESSLERLGKYLQEPAHLEFILKAHHKLIPALARISQLLLEGNSQVVENIIIICDLYFIVFGILVGFFLALAIYYHLKYTKIKIQNSNFLLTLLPEEVLQQPATIYLLKNIIKI